MSRTLFALALTLSLAGSASARGPATTRVLHGGERVSTAETISISVKNADLQDVLRLISRTAKLNLVLDDDLRGKTVTLDLVDVPWDQALDLVLRTHGLGSEWSGNVLQIASTSELASDYQQRAQLRELREQSSELITVARTLANANAADAERIVVQHLSPRGRVTIDRRTNTLIIQDTPQTIAKITGMLEYQDAQLHVVRAGSGSRADARNAGPTLASWNAWLLESQESFVGNLDIPGAAVRGVAGTPASLGRAQLERGDLELAKLLLGRLTERRRLEVVEAMPFALGPGEATSIDLGPLGLAGAALRLELGLERNGGRFALTFRCFRSSGARLPLAWHGPTAAGWIVELQPAPGQPWRVLLIEPA